MDEIIDWLLRARRLLPREDRRVLLSPPRLVSRFMRFAVHHALGGERGGADDVGARDPELIALLIELLGSVGRRYYRPRFEGVENVPASGPALLVANHSGGMVPIEGFFIELALWQRFGGKRGMYALAHDFMFDDDVLRRFALRLGLLRATGESARHAFARGDCVLVYPGGDWETFRPFQQRDRIDLGGRKGFLRLALREGVPIVPVVTAGAHEQFIVLTRGDRLARLLRMHRWARTDVFPIVLALPWGVTSGFVPYLPLPTQITVAFGAPLAWPELGPEAANDGATLERLYDEVVGRMQATLDRIAAGRHLLVGRPEPLAEARG